MPLNVFPSMTKPPLAGSRAPRWRFESLPVRRPCPHSAASTTRSSVCDGFTFSQPAPRRPASYGASSDFTMTPSWPRASASSRNACAAAASSVSRRGTTSAARKSRVERGEPLARRAVDQILAVEVEAVEEERGERRARDRGAPSSRSGSSSPGTAPAGRRRGARSPRRRARSRRRRAREATATISGTRSVMSARLRVKIAHVVSDAMRLDARAVELPLDVGAVRRARARPGCRPPSARASG